MSDARIFCIGFCLTAILMVAMVNPDRLPNPLLALLVSAIIGGCLIVAVFGNGKPNSRP